MVRHPERGKTIVHPLDTCRHHLGALEEASGPLATKRPSWAGHGKVCPHNIGVGWLHTNTWKALMSTSTWGFVKSVRMGFNKGVGTLGEGFNKGVSTSTGRFSKGFVKYMKSIMT